MTVFATLLVLGSALMHATWNLFTKRSQHPLLFLWLVNIASLVIFAPLFIWALVVYALPASGWPYILATGLLHIIYIVCLGQAYRYGALSIAYPMSRGTGVALVPLLAVPIFREQLTLPGILGIAMVVIGIGSLHASGISALISARSSGAKPVLFADMRGPLYALATGLAIAGYSLVDKAAVGILHPIVYGYMIFVSMTIGLTPWVATRHFSAAMQELKLRPGVVLLGGLLVQGTYLIILAAMQLAPVSYIVPLREVSVIFAAALGVLLLGESFGRARLIAAAIIATGVVLIAILG